MKKESETSEISKETTETSTIGALWMLKVSCSEVHQIVTVAVTETILQIRKIVSKSKFEIEKKIN